MFEQTRDLVGKVSDMSCLGFMKKNSTDSEELEKHLN